MTQQMTAREIYKAAYRNARCVRSLAPQAVINRIAKNPNNLVERARISMIVCNALLNLEDRREPMMGWFCITYENAFKLRKQKLA